MIFKNFLNIKNSKIIKKDFLKLLKDQPALFETLKPTYRYSYSKKIVKKYKKLSNLRIIGMGGSVLGSEAIYDFLKPKIKKKITFVNNLNSNADYFDSKNIHLNLINVEAFLFLNAKRSILLFAKLLTHAIPTAFSFKLSLLCKLYTSGSVVLDIQ